MPLLSQLRTEAGIGSGPVPDVPVRVAPPFLRRIWGSGTRGMTLPWAIYLSPEAYERALAGNAADLLAHEAVHVEQWSRLGPVRFLTSYLGDYVRGRLVGLPHELAYRNISLEREARERVGGSE